MKGKNTDKNQENLFFQKLENMLNPKHDLYKLANKIDWKHFDDQLSKFYKSKGRPAKPIRLMVSLMILKQLYDISDEQVCKSWVQNPYWQYFSGAVTFQWALPCDPSDLTYFRNRIGKKGVELIFQYSIRLHGEDAQEKEVCIDTTVQEKNITFPTDTKLHVKIIKKCWKIAEENNVEKRQSYSRVLKKLLKAQRFRNHPKNKKNAKAAARKIKTIAGRLVRELERQLPTKKLAEYEKELHLFNRVLAQKKGDKNKIYSLHESEVYCISKGKEHKKYEFGSKASIVMTANTGIIIGAKDVKNAYDGHTLDSVIAQAERLRGKKISSANVDKGYKGKSKVNGTKIFRPKTASKKTTAYEKRRLKQRFKRRAAIEPIIGHLKSDHGLKKCFLKGNLGNEINLIMTCTAFNLKKYMRKAREKAVLCYKHFLAEMQILTN